MATPLTAPPESAAPQASAGGGAPQASRGDARFGTRLYVVTFVLLAAGLFTIPWLHTPFRHAPLAVAYFAVLYGLLAALLVALWRFLSGCGRAWGLAGSLAIGAALALQLRMVAERLTSWPGFAGAVLAVGLVLAWRAPGGGPRRTPLLAAYVLGALFLVWVVLGLRTRESIRWHLLEHHRLVGLPAYHLGSRPIAVERELLRSRRAGMTAPAQAAASLPPPFPPSFGSGPRARGEDGRAPHIVLLMVDTLRADALAAWGGDPSLMPGTNAWVERSTVLADVQANASWTRASVASLFTGLLPEEHGAVRFQDRLDDSWTTLPEVLSGAGFQTAAFVTNWVQVGVNTGFGQGFDEFRELHSASEVQAAQELDPAGGSVRGRYARAEELNTAVLEWLARRDDARPVFLYLHYLDPHSPYLAGPEPGNEGGPRERKHGAYRQELRYLDRELVRLFEALERALPGPKAYVFTSDHGEEFWEHGEWGHGHTLYRELVWIPTFVHRTDAPGDGRRIAARLEGRDLFDLVTSLARPRPVDVGAWADARARGVRYASQYLDREVDVRPDRRWTGMRRVDEAAHALLWSAYGPTRELYRLDTDALELDNAVDREGAARRALEAELERAVGFWSVAPTVERSGEERAFLRALGYAGGT